MVSYLDKVGNCLERARDSPKACLEGIAKASSALRGSKGDSDLQCVALIKRAELLYIAVSECGCLGVCRYVCMCASM